MLFERRAYTLRPGTLETFWGLQRKWNTPTSFRPLLERNIGYFSTIAGPAERIVHLYRWDSYDQAKRHLAAIVTPERMEYFVSGRKLLVRQETAFLDPAPLPALNPVWGGRPRLVARRAGLCRRRRSDDPGGHRDRPRFRSRRRGGLLGRLQGTRCGDCRARAKASHRNVSRQYRPASPRDAVPMVRVAAAGGRASERSRRTSDVARTRRRLPPACQRESHGTAYAEPGAVDAFAVRADRLVGELGIAGAIQFLPAGHVMQRDNKKPINDEAGRIKWIMQLA